MKRLCLIAILAVICTGCIPLMHKTVAEQTVRMDKNLHELLPDYRLVLNDELAAVKGMDDGEEKTKLLEDISHDLLLLDATLMLSEDMRKTADVTLEGK